MTTQCYTKNSNKIAVSNYKPCGKTNATNPVIPCCADGDTCMTNGFCHFTRSIVGGSGYYTSGCTDAKYAAAACPKLCNDQVRTDATYSTTDKLWACCGEDKNKNPACDNATRETFDAPPPQNLLQYFPVKAGPTSTSKVTSPTSTPTKSPVDKTASPTPVPSGSSGLSAGVAGGIGAGIAIVALGIVGIAVFFILRRRKRAKVNANSTPYSPVNQEYKEQDNRPYSTQTMLTSATPSTGGHYYQPSAELSQYGSPVELPVVAEGAGGTGVAGGAGGAVIAGSAGSAGGASSNTLHPNFATGAVASQAPQELPAEDLPRIRPPSPEVAPQSLPISLTPGSTKR